MKLLVVSLLCVSTVFTSTAEGKALIRARSSRIIGGQVAFVGQFPSAAAIYVSNADATFFCAGSIISHQWILTAGHCLAGGLVFQIYLGANSLSGDDANRITLATSTFEIHPDFNPDTLEHDVGVLRLHLALTYTNYVQAAELPTSSVISGVSATAIGWGQTSDSVAGLVDQLQYVTVAPIPNTECQLSYSNIIYDTMICIAGNFNEGTCRGDSGGPLLIIEGTHQINVGISSFISTHGCESSDPSGYSRTFPHVNWIKNVTDIQ